MYSHPTKSGSGALMKGSSFFHCQYVAVCGSLAALKAFRRFNAVVSPICPTFQFIEEISKNSTMSQAQNTFCDWINQVLVAWGQI